VGEEGLAKDFIIAGATCGDKEGVKKS